MIIKRWREFTPFYFYATVEIVLAVAAQGSYRLSRALLLILGGFISWNFVEYILHRFIFHHEAESQQGRAFVHNMHLAHHADPKSLEQLFSGLRTSVPIAALYFLAGWLLTGSWQAVSYLFIGMVSGYLCYEILHYQAHHYSSKSRLLQYLKKYHMLHHHQSSELRFGVTSPFVDMLFGTYQPVSALKRKEV